MKHELFAGQQQMIRTIPGLATDFCPEQMSTALNKAGVTAATFQGKQGLTLLTMAILSLENLHNPAIIYKKVVETFQQLACSCDANIPVTMTCRTGKSVKCPPLFLLAMMFIRTQPVTPLVENEPGEETTARLHRHRSLFATLAGILLDAGAQVNAMVNGVTALDHLRHTLEVGDTLRAHGGLTGAEIGKHEAARLNGSPCACTWCNSQASQKNS
jgi:hypothetical protein